jgi:excisionase family DNA binding protein
MKDDRLLLTADDVAALLSVGRTKLYQMLAEGRIPPPVRLGRAVRWNADELRQWVAAGCPAVEEALR